MIEVRKPEQIALAIALLQQGGAEHRIPAYRAAAAGRISVVENLRGTLAPWKVLRLDAPLLMIVGDDDHQSTGPAGWPQAKRLLRWARVIMLHGCGGEAWHYEEAASAAEACRRMLMIETSSEHAPAWRALAREVAPSTGGMEMRVQPGGTHPVWGREAGEVMQ